MSTEGRIILLCLALAALWSGLRWWARHRHRLVAVSPKGFVPCLRILADCGFAPIDPLCAERLRQAIPAGAGLDAVLVALAGQDRVTGAQVCVNLRCMPAAVLDCCQPEQVAALAGMARVPSDLLAVDQPLECLAAQLASAAPELLFVFHDLGSTSILIGCVSRRQYDTIRQYCLPLVAITPARGR